MPARDEEEIMHRIVRRTRGRWAVLGAGAFALPALAALALLAVPALSAAAPAGSGRVGVDMTAQAAHVTAARLGTTSIVVVRRLGTQDSLWLVSASDASSIKIVDLPFRPARVLASPDGTKVAILPAKPGGRVYVCYLLHAKLAALSFISRGVRHIDGMTWLSATRLLVSGSGSNTAHYYPFADKLCVATTTPGKPAVYRHLHGTEPSAAPGAKRLVYVRLRDGGAVAAQPGARFVVESLVSLKLATGSRPHVIKHVRYIDSLDIRRFRDPAVSPDGKDVVTSTTGSDISVSYMVRSVATGKVLQRTNTTLAGRDATAWSPVGEMVAFWGMPPASSETKTNVYVYHAATKTRTSDGPFANVAVGGLAWAPDESLLAYSLRGLGQAADRGELWTIDPGTSATPTDLGQGALPVWLP
jgi:hypothetical protein